MDFDWNVRVVGSNDGLHVYCRQQTFRIGDPVSFDTEYKSLTSLEQFLGAIAADLVGGYRRRAKKQRIEYFNIEANLKCQLHNPLMFLDVVGESGSPAIKRICGQVYIDTLADPADVHAAWNKTLELSPLYQTLNTVVDFDVEVKIV